MTATASSLRQIGAKTFSSKDQQLFAQVSRDCNPMHMDAVAARRLMTGRPVVHGVHILLTAIECWRNEAASAPISIACTFNNPVNVGESVIFHQFAEADNKSTIQANVNDLLCSTVTLTTSPRSAATEVGSRLAESASGDDICILDPLADPFNEEPEFHLGKLYAVEPNDSDFSELFPKSHQYLGKSGFASLAALSYIVGMVCPGLHSVFSSLEIDLHPEGIENSLLRFWVRKFDPRFRLFDIEFSGCIQGRIKAFLRPPPQAQPSVRAMSKYVGFEEFIGSRSLVIGGSRGLGEVTAKILAAGGGDTIITYASGLDDAKAISDEINSGGRSHCKVRKLDLTTDPFDSVDVDWNTLDAVYFFATPRIFRKKVGIFDPELFREFCDLYIGKFHELCVFLEANVTIGKVVVCFPSTVFIEERPRGMAEYAMAKSAAEVLIQEINRTFKNLMVFCTRLPRLSTDQTASIITVTTESNVETLLSFIRSSHRCSTIADS